jgi:hypothetical protein
MIDLTYSQIHQLDIVPLCYFDIAYGTIDKEVENETVGYARCGNKVVPIVNICANLSMDVMIEVMPYFCPIRNKIVSGRENSFVTDKSYMMSVAVLGKTIEKRDGEEFDRVYYANISDYEQCAGSPDEVKDILLPVSIFDKYPNVYDTMEIENGFALTYPSILERDVKNYNDGEYLQAYQYLFYEAHNNLYSKSTENPVVRFCLEDGTAEFYEIIYIEGGGILSETTLLHFIKVSEKECYYAPFHSDMLIYDCKNRKWIHSVR